MLAAGLSDGNVAVYNLQKNPQKPSYISTARNGKHTDIVWQVKKIFPWNKFIILWNEFTV